MSSEHSRGRSRGRPSPDESGGAPSTLVINRRHICSFSPRTVLHRFTDVVIVGTGVAGLRAAIQVVRDSNLNVTLVSKGRVRDANTDRAQGGIAAVLDPQRTGDALSYHVEDTLASGCGLADEAVVRITVEEGVERVRELIEWGAQFDTSDGAIDFTQEGGHRRPRILHARGDATGCEILGVLLRTVRAEPRIQLIEDAFSLDLLGSEGRCVGLLAWERNAGPVAVWAKTVVLASGGYGRLFRETTNGPHSTGDGLAMAYRAGAALRDLEFIQFHPTTLYVAGAERFLITEAARGEGGLLKDHTGARFMDDYHPMAELAPRDVVARAILDRMNQTRQPMVYLDLREIGAEKLGERFPGIVSICRQFGIDPGREPIPVRPSAHYTIGGIVTDSWGRSTLPGLYACGEAAATGLHGANRLGSNSLLEGLVFGQRAGRKAAEDAVGCPEHRGPAAVAFESESQPRQVDTQDLRRSLESLMVREVGILRHRDRLAEARRLFSRWSQYVGHTEFRDPAGWELQNMLLVGLLVTESALWRRESRGSHFREDFPDTRTEYARSLTVSRRTL